MTSKDISTAASVIVVRADRGSTPAFGGGLPDSWRLIVTHDGRTALRAARRWRPMAVLADARLLQRDDWRLLSALRESVSIARAPIIALAHADEVALCAACLAAGVDDCLVEPVSGSDVRLRVTMHAELARLSRQSLVTGGAGRTAATAETESQAKDRFIAVLGHELRNPISAIARAAELMRLLGHDGREQAIIERQVRHMTRLVDDVLDVARIQADKLVLRKEPVEVADIVHAAVELVGPLLEARRHRLEIDAPQGIYAIADQSRMSQVVSNLLDNAAKYSGVGSRISVVAARRGDWIRLAVADEGVGIDPYLLERVFEPFAQQHAVHHHAGSGLGLGLAIVRRIVEMHEGRVQAHSAGPGTGSEFVIEIPGR